MLRPLILAATLVPGAIFAQDAEQPETGEEVQVLTRPGLAEGAEAPLPSDDLAECAAMIAVVSSRATQRIQREKLQMAAGQWFAKAGDVAISEGGLPGEEVWGEKVAAWAGRISSIGSLTAHSDWVEYCIQVGDAHGMAPDGLTGS